MSFGRCMGKENVVYVHKGILFSYKLKEILPFVTAWMNLEGIMLNKLKNKTKQDAS